MPEVEEERGLGVGEDGDRGCIAIGVNATLGRVVGRIGGRVRTGWRRMFGCGGIGLLGERARYAYGEMTR